MSMDNQIFELISRLRKEKKSWSEIVKVPEVAQKYDRNINKVKSAFHRRKRAEKGRPYGIVSDDEGQSYEPQSIPDPEPYVPPKEKTIKEEIDGLGDQSLIAGDSYVYNRTDDVYVTFVPSAPKKHIVLPGAVHRSMLQAYSNWDGTPATINEIAREFGLTRQQFIEYKKAHGWTHDLEPVTSEEMLDPDYDEDEVIGSILSMRRQSLYRRFEKEKWKQTKQAAERWFKFETYVLRYLEDMIREGVEFPSGYSRRQSETGVRSDRLLVLSTADMHLGKKAYGEKSSLNQDIELVVGVIEDLLELADPFNVGQIMFVVGSDFLHVDNDHGTTTNGTRQDMHAEVQEVVIRASQLVVRIIDDLRKIAPVEVVFTPGNHDRLLSWTTYLYASAWFIAAGAEDVTFSDCYKERQYRLFGSNLIGITHGDGIKLTALPSIMAAEVPDLWGKSKHRMWFTGHLHHEKVMDHGGVVLYQTPSIVLPDKWHYRKGYVTSARASHAYVVEDGRGVIAMLKSVVE